MYASPVACLVSPSAVKGTKPAPGLVAIDDEVLVGADQLVADVLPLLNDVSADGSPISLTSLLESAPADAGRLLVDGSRIVYRRAPGYSGTFAVGYRAQTPSGASADGDISFIVTASGSPLTFPKDPPAAASSVSATASTFATVYAAATAGQHIVLADGDYGALTLSRAFDASAPLVIRAQNPGVPRLTGLVNVTGSGHWLHQLNLANVPSGLTASLSRAERLAKAQVQVTTAGDRFLWITRCLLRSEIAVRIGPRVHHVKIGWCAFDGQLSTPNGAHIDLEQGLFTDAADALRDVLIYRNDFKDDGTRWFDAAGAPIENHHIFLYQDYASGSSGLRALRNVVIAENRFKTSKRRCWFMGHLGCLLLDNDVDMPDASGASITPTADEITMSASVPKIDANILGNDSVSPASAGLKVAQVRAVSGSGPSGSGLVVPSIINGGAAGGPNIRITRNAEPAGAVKVQYKPSTADGSYTHPDWVDVTVTLSATGGNWWQMPIRSGRPWASGVAYWMGLDDSATNPDITAEEADVALIDAGTGTSRARGTYSSPPYTSNVGDWNGVIGGAVSAAMVTTNTQMDTNPNVLFGIGDIIAQLPTGVAGGSGWIDWVLQTTPDSLDTNNGANETAWDQIIAGDHDAKYRKLGERLVAKATAVGHPIGRFLFDLNREMNDPDNVYGIRPGSRLKYKQAIERTIDKMREGAGVHLRFLHRPAWKHNIGDLTAWTPNNIDVIALSIHPDNSVTSDSDITKMFNGTLSTDYYGINHLLATSDAMGIPIAFPEWSPRFEAGKACPVARTFVERFYSDVLVPNKDRLVCECIYKENVRQTGTGAYKGGDAAGLAQWNAMVSRRKVLWSGIKSS